MNNLSGGAFHFAAPAMAQASHFLEILFSGKKKKKNLCIIEMWMQLLSLGNCVVLT